MSEHDQAQSTGSFEQALARESGEIRISGYANLLTITLLAAWSIFQLYLSSGLGPFLAVNIGFGIVNDIYARAAHVAFGASLCFLLFAGGKTRHGPRHIPWYDYALAATRRCCMDQTIVASRPYP